MATTGSPMRMVAGSASVAAGSSPSTSTRSSARSLPGSVAITVAGVGSVLPEKRTRTSCGPADDVGVGKDLPVGGDDHSGADRLAGLLAERRPPH